jgi:hypothetical protein
VRQIVNELGMPGGPRVELVDSAFSLLTGQQFGPAQGFSSGIAPPRGFAPAGVILNRFGHVPVAFAPPGQTADDIPGQLGALRDRFGLTDDNVNTVEEEQVRTAFLTLVDLIVDLQRSWQQQRVAFGSDVGRGFLGTELVLINRLMAASAEQVDELEAVLESALVSAAERQTIELDTRTRLTLDGLLGWMRSFLTEDGPRIARDTGRDGLTTSFTPTVLAILQALRCTLVARLVPCGSARCGGLGSCGCGRKGLVSYIPLGCCSPLPPGMYAGRTRIAVSGLCGLLERLGRAAARIGRFSGAVLLDVVVTRFDDIDPTAVPPSSTGADFVRVEVRGLHLRPSYLPAFVTGGGAGRQLEELILPVRGSASADSDSVVAVFDRRSLPAPLANLNLGGATGAVFAAAEVPLALIDGETGRIVVAPTVTTWPDLRPAATPDGSGGPSDWDELPLDQRWAPQSTGTSQPEDEDCVETDECTEPCRQQCDEHCGAECDCDCGCHLWTRISAVVQGAARYVKDSTVQDAAKYLWEAIKKEGLVNDEVRQGVEGAAKRAKTSEVPAKVGNLLHAMEEVERAGAAGRPAVRPQPASPVDILAPDKGAAAASNAIDRARADLAAAEMEAKQFGDLATQHERDAEEATRRADETAEWATVAQARVGQSARAAAAAVRRRQLAEQRLVNAERDLRIARVAIETADKAAADKAAADKAAADKAAADKAAADKAGRRRGRRVTSKDQSKPNDNPSRGKSSSK